jgi:hypothetical protein
MGAKEKVYRQQGLCGGCGKVKSEQYYCDDCKLIRKNKRDINSKKRLARQKSTYKYRKENNLCTKCGCIKFNDASSCEKCLEKKRSEQKNRKLRCFAFYGQVCACCSETNFKFLNIDHVNGDGNKHRKEIGGTFANSKLYSWLIRNDFPSGFQTLCFNCNRGRWMNNNVCPHKEDNPLHLSDFNLDSSLKQQLLHLISLRGLDSDYI